MCIRDSGHSAQPHKPQRVLADGEDRGVRQSVACGQRAKMGGRRCTGCVGGIGCVGDIGCVGGIGVRGGERLCKRRLSLNAAQQPETEDCEAAYPAPET